MGNERHGFPIRSVGNNDMFSYNGECLTIINIDGKYIAIEAPYKLNRFADFIDTVIWTHNDTDHSCGLSTFLFRKLLDPAIVSLNTVVNDFWRSNMTYMGINRSTGRSIPIDMYADVCTIHFAERRSIPNITGLEIESFKRSTKHGLFDTLAFKLLYKGDYILGYSGDTEADNGC